jgi:hypothetical protein
VFNCTQCGGALHPDEGQIFLTCPYCNSTVYLDKTQVVFHWYLAPTLDEQKARAALARWMAGNQTVKDLDKKARLMSSAFQYFPLWYFKRRMADGKESILLEPAAAISVSEVRNIKLPAGDLRKYDPALDADAQVPSVPLEAVTKWLEERQVPGKELAERALVHLPLYGFKYNYQDKEYMAVVEAGTGGVFANIYPAKAEVPYQLIGGLTALVFLCISTFPVVGALSGYAEGILIGIALYVMLALLAAPVLFALALWIAAKV